MPSMMETDPATDDHFGSDLDIDLDIEGLEITSAPGRVAGDPPQAAQDVDCGPVPAPQPQPQPDPQPFPHPIPVPPTPPPCEPSDPFSPELIEIYQEIEKTRAKTKALKESLSLAKKKHDALIDDMLEIIGNYNTPMPLFDQPKPLASSQPQPQSAQAVHASPDPVPAAPAVDPEAWRSDSVELLVELGLAAKTVQKLLEAELATIGAIADYSASGRQLIDIDGIGPKKVEAIELSLEKYWANRKAPSETPEFQKDPVQKEPEFIAEQLPDPPPCPQRDPETGILVYETESGVEVHESLPVCIMCGADCDKSESVVTSREKNREYREFVCGCCQKNKKASSS